MITAESPQRRDTAEFFGKSIWSLISDEDAVPASVTTVGLSVFASSTRERDLSNYYGKIMWSTLGGGGGSLIPWHLLKRKVL